ncbi:Trm112 family protein, partial [Falsiroseomonas oryzae]|uniref:Trm112 family protein n=1 Tax=Falsiroseomonas oryzae TaxID=2766473 RepID=UPI0038CC1347
MRRGHFAAFRPVCPVCLRRGAGAQPLVLAAVAEETGEDVRAGVLLCPDAACRHEYPILDGIPVIVPELRRLMSERGVELLLRDDVPEMVESLLGDAIGPDSWLDATRQTVSTYAWDAWAGLDPAEAPDPGGPVPGAVRRCLRRLLELRGAGPEGGLVLDAG